MTYEHCLNYLDAMGEQKMDFDLSRIRKAREYYDCPDRAYPSFLVAGTNGKGSSVHLLSSILRCHGLKVGSFISPHLHHLRERILLNARPISEVDFAHCCGQVIQDIQTAHILPLTYFEIVCMSAAIYFRNQGVDVAVFEVGLGGRLDATNVFKHQYAGIASISEDHQHYLGDTLEKIAIEKSMVIHEEMEVAVQEQSHETLTQIFIDRAAHVDAEIYVAGQNYHVTPMAQMLSPQDRPELSFHFRLGKTVETYCIESPGLHQMKNAGLALRLAKLYLGEVFSHAKAQEAFNLGLPSGRMERFQLPGHTLILDVAHNVGSMETLVQALSQMDAPQIILWMGMQQHKAWAESLKILAALPAELWIQDQFSANAWSLEDVQPLAASLFQEVSSISRLEQGLEKLKTIKPDTLVVCCGSFYFVGPLRTLLKF